MSREAFPTNFTTLLLPGHKSRERIKKKKANLCSTISIPNVNVKQQPYRLVSQTVLQKNQLLPKVSVSRTDPHCVWELFSHVSL